MNPGDVEPLLERLPGVLAATVFNDSDRGPVLYLATAPGGDRTALRGAVLEILRDRGLPTDPERIHIAAPPPTVPSTGPLPTFTLDALDVHRTGSRIECVVRLRSGGRMVDGTATEPDTDGGRGRAGGRATLAAVERLDPDLRLGLHGVRRLEVFGQQSVVALVEAAVGRAYAMVPGIALVERSVEESAARAALQALRSWSG